MIVLLPRAPAEYDQTDQQQLRGALERDSGTNVKKNIPFDFVPVLPSYAKASLPSATKAAGLIYVTDDVGGATPAFSDGTNWRRTADRNVIS